MASTCLVALSHNSPVSVSIIASIVPFCCPTSVASFGSCSKLSKFCVAFTVTLMQDFQLNFLGELLLRTRDALGFSFCNLCIVSLSCSLPCCWSAVPIPRLTLDLGSGAECEDLAQSLHSLMRAFKAGMSTMGKTHHAEAAITLWWCQTSRKIIRAVPVSGGEPRGCSQQRGLPAVCAEVMRFWKQPQMSAGQSRSYLRHADCAPTHCWQRWENPVTHLLRLLSKIHQVFSAQMAVGHNLQA